MIQSRPQFGYVGAILVWVVALLAYIGFNAFNQILAAQTVQSLYGGNPAATEEVAKKWGIPHWTSDLAER